MPTPIDMLERFHQPMDGWILAGVFLASIAAVLVAGALGKLEVFHRAPAKPDALTGTPQVWLLILRIEEALLIVATATMIVLLAAAGMLALRAGITGTFGAAAAVVTALLPLTVALTQTVLVPGSERTACSARAAARAAAPRQVIARAA